MATGSISSWSKKSKNGRIQPDEGGKELNFKIKQLQGVDKKQAKLVKKGMRVSFTLNGGRIDAVQLIDGLPSEKKAPAPQKQRQEEVVTARAQAPQSPKVVGSKRTNERANQDKAAGSTLKANRQVSQAKASGQASQAKTSGQASQAKASRQISTPAPQRTTPSSRTRQRVRQGTGRSGQYRFLNPYNFVRPLDVAFERAAPLLGRCLPPPHDRYVGLTGRITCRLTATTPLFVSDSEGISVKKEDGKEHFSYRFFRSPDDKVAIPGTSLRGAFRSIFEAVTNSCFSVFDGGRFDLREGELPHGLVPARVVEVDKDGVKLERLDCSSGNFPRGVRLHRRRREMVPLMKAASVSAYEEQVLDTKENQVFKPSESLIDEKLKDGDRVAAVIDLNPVNNKVYQYFDVLEVTPAKKHRSLKVEAGKEAKVFGYLHITGPNIEKKHLERVFFRWDDRTPEAPKWDTIPKKAQVPVGLETIEEYNDHLSRYWERNRRQIERLGEKPWPIDAQVLPHPSYFIQKDRKLRQGDLVYYIPQSKLGIPVLRPVLISRLPYKYDRAALLPPALHACQEYSQLCPACRTFGWVWEPKNKEEAEAAGLEKQAAYAGRVRFGMAELCVDGGTFDATLGILSTPKPTTTRFYLAPKTGNLRDGRPDHEVGYDNQEQRLRGRKVYRHHGKQLSPQEYESAGGKKSDQNRTVRGVQQEGSVFKFDLSFENLAPLELGALLWTLELEAGMNHRLGYGKPLGFGSVRVEIEGLKLLNTVDCYASLEANQWVNGLTHKSSFLGEFKKAMAERFGQAFSQLANVADLKQLMKEPPPLPIHYPRPTRRPSPDGKNYEWFVGNKQSGRRTGPKLVLPLPADEADGLPLVNRRGQVVR